MFTIRLRRRDIAMADSPRDEKWEVAEDITVAELAQLVVDRHFLAVSSAGIRWTMGRSGPSRSGEPTFAVIDYAPAPPRTAPTRYVTPPLATVHQVEPGGLDRPVLELPIVDRHGVATVWFVHSWPQPPRP